MLRASIFQKNILNENPKSRLVENFNNNLVEIDNSNLKILNNEKIILLNSPLKKIEEDFNTTTYIGKFSDDENFRVIRPNDIPLANLKEEFNCVSAFSIASINPDGYAIHFILTEVSDVREIQNNNSAEKEQIQRLLEGSVLALQNKLHQNFIDYTKRLINLVDQIDELNEYEYGSDIIQIMKDNDQIYSQNEKSKIYS